jgi:hypothetical protein
MHNRDLIRYRSPLDTYGNLTDKAFDVLSSTAA